MSLTDSKVKNAKSLEKEYKLTDGFGIPTGFWLPVFEGTLTPELSGVQMMVRRGSSSVVNVYALRLSSHAILRTRTISLPGGVCQPWEPDYLYHLPPMNNVHDLVLHAPVPDAYGQ